MVDGINDDEMIIKFILAADKKASVQTVEDTTKSMKDVIENMVESLNKGDINIAENLFRVKDKNGKELANKYWLVLKKADKYIKQKIQITKNGISALGNFSMISQAEAWGLGGVDAKSVYKNIEKATKPINKTMSSSQKFLNTFKRIGFYRLARRVFQILEQGLSDGINKLAEFDSEFKKTMSSFTTSFERIKLSIAIAFAPLLETIAPILDSISGLIAQIANGFSRAAAASKGLSEYTKIDLKKMKEFGKETKKVLASFDKFETLSSQDDESILTKQKLGENEELSELESSGEKIFNTLNGVWEVLGKLWDVLSPLLEPLMEIQMITYDIISTILDVLMPVLEPLIDVLKSVFQQIIGALQFISAFLKLLTGDFEGAFDLIKKAAHNMIEGIVNMFISGINLLIKSILTPVRIISKIIDGIFGTETEDFINSLQIPKVKVPEFANGGMVDRGSLFIAGESGAEFVTQMPSGQTGVTNVQQFKQAMVEALYEAQDIFQQNEGTVVLDLDGAEIARSKRFKGELNRTNAGLNLI